MQLVQQCLFFVMIGFIGIQLVLAGNKNRNSAELTDEKTHSLLDIEDDTDGITSTMAIPTTTEVQPEPTTVATKQTDSTKKSRKIKLPDDYNKLEIPKKPNITKGLMNSLTADEFDKLTPEDIASYEAVFKGDEPLPIAIEVKVRNIRDIDEIDEEITVELDFILHWLDRVILYETTGNNLTILSEMEKLTDRKSIDPVFLREVWKPDIFIENVISITRPELISKPVRLWFTHSGYFVFATRVTVKMDCEMKFHYYPADTQHCTFRLRSYSYTNQDVNITWEDEALRALFLLDRSEHNFDVKLNKLETKNETETEGLLDFGYNETYSVLRFQISARRKLSYHLIQTYLPSTFFIIITWLSFLVPTTMVEARIGISMTTLLTLTSMFASVRENTPIVSYVKAIDIWMVACIFFVFITLLEFTLLTWRRHLKPKKQKFHEYGSDDNAKPQSIHINITDKAENVELGAMENYSREPHHLSPVDKYLKGFKEENIEKYGFLAFSLLFVIFNVVYWPWLLVYSKYFSWSIDFAYNSRD